jgi:transcriptional regulator with XRE-family HTH domain
MARKANGKGPKWGPAEREFYVRTGERVAAARRAIGISQDELAAKVGLGRVSVCNIEAGKQAIKLHRVPAFCRALKVGPAKLLL